VLLQNFLLPPNANSPPTLKLTMKMIIALTLLALAAGTHAGVILAGSPLIGNPYGAAIVGASPYATVVGAPLVTSRLVGAPLISHAGLVSHGAVVSHAGLVGAPLVSHAGLVSHGAVLAGPAIGQTVIAGPSGTIVTNNGLLGAPLLLKK
jgi:hypothetical protein